MEFGDCTAIHPAEGHAELHARGLQRARETTRVFARFVHGDASVGCLSSELATVEDVTVRGRPDDRALRPVSRLAPGGLDRGTARRLRPRAYHRPTTSPPPPPPPFRSACGRRLTTDTSDTASVASVVRPVVLTPARRGTPSSSSATSAPPSRPTRRDAASTRAALGRGVSYRFIRPVSDDERSRR